jgi:hypothetical protein
LRSRAIAALLACCAAGAAALGLVAATDERSLAFTINSRAVKVVAAARPGEDVCQRGLEAAEPFGAVLLRLTTDERPGPPLAVAVLDADDGRVLARGRLPAGTKDGRDSTVRVTPEVGAGELFDVCFRNEGVRDVGFWGGPTIESPGHAFEGAQPAGGDLRVVFLRSEPRSALALVPDMFEHASRFRPDPVGPWTFWALLVAVAAGIPALLALALRRAGGS